jgi:predicted outer membrane repeat protein
LIPPHPIPYRSLAILVCLLAWLTAGCSLRSPSQRVSTPTPEQVAALEQPTALPSSPTATLSPQSAEAATTVSSLPIFTGVPTATLTIATTPPAVGTIVVDSFEQESPFMENGDCTLGEAIAAANTRQAVDSCAAGEEDSTIVLQPGAYTLRVVDKDPQVALGELIGSGGENGLPPIGTNLTIDGNGATILRQGGAPNFRILEVFAGKVTLKDLTLSNGNASRDGEGGGGLFVSGPGAEVTLNNVTISSNLSSGAGAPGGGIANHGTLVLHDSQVAQNTALSSGGGIDNAGSLSIQSSLVISNTSRDSAGSTGGGGGLYNEGGGSRAIVEDTRFEGNQATQGGGVYNSGAITITHSLILNNTASEDGKTVIQPQGGGGLNNGGEGASAVVSDSLIAGNSAPLSIGGGVYNNQMLTVYRTLIQANQAETGNGIYNERVTGTVQITYSCLVRNDLVNAVGAPAALAAHIWWDSPLGPREGVQFSGEVSYIPFLPAMPNACARWEEVLPP